MSKLSKITGYIGTTFGVVLLLAILVMSLPMGGWRALSVQTGSMAPAIRPGALVLVHRVPESSLHVGDVITYASQSNRGTTVTHRIVSISTAGSLHQVIVKGDANQVADSPVAPSQIVGKVVHSVPVLGRIVTFTHKPIGLAVLVYLPALLIIIYELRLLVRRLAKIEVEKAKPLTASGPPADMSSSMSSNDSKPVLSQTTLTHRRAARRIDGMLVLLLLVLAVTSITGSTRAALNSKATLTGTTISTAPVTTPPVTTSTCTSTNNSVNVTNTSNQTATSGNASVNNSTTSNSATSGSASNTNTTSTTVTIHTGC